MINKSILTLFLLFNIAITHAEPKLFSSDWPVWNLTEGMHRNGLLEGFNYKIKKYETTLKWFKAGNLEVTFMTLYDFISLQPTQKPTVILGITDYSNGGDKIILRNNIKKPRDLKGKKVLLASNTISLWLFHNYLKKHGMNLNDVVIINQNVNLAPLQFKEDLSFSAVVGWNPNINTALSDNSYIASTSADFPRVIYDLVVARKDFVDSSSEQIEKFLTTYYKGLGSEAVLKKTAESLFVSSDEYRTWLDDANIFTSKSASDRERQHLQDSANRIIEFLSTAPNSLHHKETRKRFKPRVLNLDELIHQSSNEQQLQGASNK